MNHAQTPPPDEPYYRRDLARVHHLGFAFHAEECAQDILSLLEPIRERDGLVVEVGCGSGLLTRHLVDAGHRVVATDASPAMLDLARAIAPGARIQRLTLPLDPIPEANAIVSVGHALNYLPDEEAIDAALVTMADALRPGGVLAIDVCDLAWGEARVDEISKGWAGDDWALVTEFSVPTPDRYVRQMAVFTQNDDGTWRRDDERHDNVLLDTSTIPARLAERGIVATCSSTFGDHILPKGLVAVVGRRPLR